MPKGIESHVPNLQAALPFFHIQVLLFFYLGLSQQKRFFLPSSVNKSFLAADRFSGVTPCLLYL